MILDVEEITGLIKGKEDINQHTSNKDSMNSSFSHSWIIQVLSEASNFVGQNTTALQVQIFYTVCEMLTNVIEFLMEGFVLR